MRHSLFTLLTASILCTSFISTNASSIELSGIDDSQIAITVAESHVAEMSYIVTFKVNAKGLQPKQAMKKLNAIVNVEAFVDESEGKVDVGEMNEKGLITVKWRPINTSSKLKATIDSKDGYYITEAIFEQTDPILCPDDIHPHIIDLGLPSGTKWCCSNVGAGSPEKTGSYFSWGETTVKDKHAMENYLYYEKKSCDYINIGGDISGTDYDAAKLVMMKPWSMPSSVQITELRENCRFFDATVKGVEGTLVVGKNRERIFIPDTGVSCYLFDYEENKDKEQLTETDYGVIWTSSAQRKDGNSGNAFKASFSGWDVDMLDVNRHLGMNIRAVCQ